ncbi:MAG: ribosome maturation factor RimM [Candidatus Dormibacteraceae bacterium]
MGAGAPATVRVGLLTGAFGVEGAVVVLPLTDFEDRFAPGAEVALGGDRHRVEWARRRRAGHVVVKLSGLDDRTLAGRQRGRYLEIPAGQARPLPAGSFYHHQLIGLRVATASGRSLGPLVDVLPRPANDVWVTRAGEGVEHLIPATREAVLAVSLEEGRVMVADWVGEMEPA